MLSRSQLLKAAQLAVRTSTASRCFSISASRNGGGLTAYDTGTTRDYIHTRIGDREIVGFGAVGDVDYADNPMFPFPAIRWKSPNAPGVPELRQKELGDWKKLTMEEKKGLYRASFCQTLVEFRATDKGVYKQVAGGTLMALALTLWLWFFCKLYVYNALPESFSEEGRLARLKWDIALRMDPVQGISSRWDYEKDQWKE